MRQIYCLFGGAPPSTFSPLKLKTPGDFQHMKNDINWVFPGRLAADSAAGF